jgi:hypothetical protein
LNCIIVPFAAVRTITGIHQLQPDYVVCVSIVSIFVMYVEPKFSLNAMFQIFISISSLVINEGSYDHMPCSCPSLLFA